MNKGWTVFLLMPWLLAIASFSQGASPSASIDDKAEVWELFLQANKAYKQNDFQQAANLYEELLASHNSPKLSYNLGNAYFRHGQLGKAILNYRRGLKLLPRDFALKYNLQLSRQRTKDKIEVKGAAKFKRLFPLGFYTLSNGEGRTLFLFFYSLFWVSMSLHLFIRGPSMRQGLKRLAQIGGVLAFVMGLSLIYRFYWDHYREEGVVIVEEAEVHAGNGEEYMVLFKIHDGTELWIDEKREGWHQIQLYDGKRGWVKSEEVTTL